jgi:hypothetical protein
MITGQALANLGRDIGEGIEKYQKNKQITATSLAQLEAIGSARPDAYAALKTAGGDVSQSISNIEKGDYKQKDVLAALGAINTYLGTQEAAQQSRISALQLEALEAEAEARKQPVTPFEPRTRKINGVTYVEVQPDEFEPLKQPTPTTTAGKPIIGRKVTMDELNQLRDEGYKPTVKFDSGGEMIMTDLGTFAPQDTVTEPLTVGQEKMLEETAKDLAPWGTGGKQQAEANLATYDNLLTGLVSGEITTRGFADLTPQALGIDDSLRQLLNPTGQDAVDNVRRVIFQGLKDTLGAQFTQREAERLVAASYNPALPEEMNISRLQDARDVLADVIAAKNDLYAHISAGGTMGDYKGVAPAAVLSSGIKATQDKYDADPEKGGFQAPSGITIRVKSKRPTK